MGKATEIAWCDHTFNPWWGCHKISRACDHCYAEQWAKRTGQDVWGLKSPRRFFGDKHWREPLRWDAQAARDGVRRRVFCASMADVCEDRRDLDPWREKLWGLIRRTDNLDWLLLTKRADCIGRLVPEDILARAWMGVTAENQQCADERWGHLSQVDAKVRFLSCEPLIERVTVRHWATLPDWIICGGESGGKARHFGLPWARQLRDECRELGIAFFMKQFGAFADDWGRGDDRELVKLRHRAGADPDEWPEDLRVRQFPEVTT